MLYLIFFTLALYPGLISGHQCDFLAQNAVCPLSIENVIDIEVGSMKMDSLEKCQYECFLDSGCHNFTYFANDAGKRCILFRGCQSTMPCMKCVSGPRMPPIMKCGQTEKKNERENLIGLSSQNLEQRPGEPEITTFRPPIKLPRLPKQGFDGEGDDNTFDVEFIDDGLFGEEDEEEEGR